MLAYHKLASHNDRINLCTLFTRSYESTQQVNEERRDIKTQEGTLVLCWCVVPFVPCMYSHLRCFQFVKQILTTYYTVLEQQGHVQAMKLLGASSAPLESEIESLACLSLRELSHPDKKKSKCIKHFLFRDLVHVSPPELIILNWFCLTTCQNKF